MIGIKGMALKAFCCILFLAVYVCVEAFRDFFGALGFMCIFNSFYQLFFFFHFIKKCLLISAGASAICLKSNIHPGLYLS